MERLPRVDDREFFSEDLTGWPDFFRMIRGASTLLLYGGGADLEPFPEFDRGSGRVE